MMTLNDGRSELWQWDTGRKLAVDAECSQVHFSNKVFGRSIDVDVADGVAIIPDVLLQTDKDLFVWAFVGTAENGYTKISKTFKVNRRNKPADYVFTPPDQTSLEEIKEKIEYLESIQDPDAIKNAVDDYLANNPIMAKETDPTVPAWAKQPEKPSYSKSEVGLGNVDNVKQYSASNPPPYPVTSVNGKTGAVTLDIVADAVRYVEQTLTEAQKAQARQNIGAYSKDDDYQFVTIALSSLTLLDGYYKRYNSEYSTTDSIKTYEVTDFKTGDIFRVSGRNCMNCNLVTFLNDGDRVISCYPNANNTETYTKAEITVPDGASRMLFGSDKYRDTLLLEKKVLVVNDYPQKEDNPLFGKKLALEGDSICYGSGYVGGYGAIIAERNSMTVYNTAVGGGTITSGIANRHCIADSIANMNADADYYIIEGGINDYGLRDSIEFGEMLSYYPTSAGAFDSTTFIGALELCCYTLYNSFPGKKVGFIFVHVQYCDEWDTVWKPTMKAVLNKWGVPYLDLATCVPPLNKIATLKTAYTNEGDGMHPNEEGYKKYYCDAIEGWLKSLHQSNGACANSTQNSETWTFTLEDGSTVTKKVVLA